MSFRPQDYYVGVLTFFSVLLPGAVATWVFSETWATQERMNSIFGWEIPRSGPSGWVAFLISSYLVGQLLLVLEAVLRFVPSRWRRLYYNKRRRLLLELAKEQTPEWKEILSTEGLLSIGGFDFAVSAVRVRSTPAAHEIDSTMGASKFLGNMSVVLLLLAVTAANNTVRLLCSVAALLCLGSHSVMRFEAELRAYEYFVVLYPPGSEAEPLTSTNAS